MVNHVKLLKYILELTYCKVFLILLVKCPLFLQFLY